MTKSQWVVIGILAIASIIMLCFLFSIPFLWLPNNSNTSISLIATPTSHATVLPTAQNIIATHTATVLPRTNTPIATSTPQATPTPTSKPSPTPDPSEGIYLSSVQTILDNYSNSFDRLTALFLAASANPSLLKSDAWASNTGFYLAKIKTNNQQVRSLKVPQKYASAQADLVAASIHYDRYVTLFVAGIDKRDDKLLAQSQAEFVLAKPLIQHAMSKIASQQQLPTPTAKRTTTDAGDCPPVNPGTIRKSAFIKSVTLATDVAANTYTPINPTTTFARTAIVHLVVAIQNVPTNTLFKVKWYANDVGTAAPCNTFVDEVELYEAGTKNLDYTLGAPNPVGTYRAEIYVNGNLHQVIAFAIR